MMDGKTFRAMANYAVDEIAKFIDEFPLEFYPTMRINTKLGVIVVGLEKDNEEDQSDV